MRVLSEFVSTISSHSTKSKWEVTSKTSCVPLCLAGSLLSLIAAMTPAASNADTRRTFTIDGCQPGEIRPSRELKWDVTVPTAGKQRGSIRVNCGDTPDTPSEMATALAKDINTHFAGGPASASGDTVDVTPSSESSFTEVSGLKVTLNKEEYLALSGSTAGNLGFLADPDTGFASLAVDATVIAGFNDGPAGLDLVSFNVAAGTTQTDLAIHLQNALNSAGYVTARHGEWVTVFADGAFAPTRLDFALIPISDQPVGQALEIAIDDVVPEPGTLMLSVIGLVGLVGYRRRRISHNV
jgi:uncharacterized protein (DUF2141 family)